MTTNELERSIERVGEALLARCSGHPNCKVPHDDWATVLEQLERIDQLEADLVEAVEIAVRMGRMTPELAAIRKRQRELFERKGGKK